MYTTVSTQKAPAASSESGIATWWAEVRRGGIVLPGGWRLVRESEIRRREDVALGLGMDVPEHHRSAIKLPRD